MAFEGNVVTFNQPTNLIELWGDYCKQRGLTDAMLAPLNGAVMPLGKPLRDKLGTRLDGLRAFGVVGAYVFEMSPGEYRGRAIQDFARIDSVPKPGESGPPKLKEKYCAPFGATNLIYISPLIKDWYDPDATYDLYIVEGALNAVRLVGEGLHAVSIPGVQNYHVGKKTSPIIPALERLVINCKGRVIVMFDSDAADPESNPKVWNAQNTFLQDMLRLRGANRNSLHVCNPPPREDGSKNGPDDYLNAVGINEFNAYVADECRAYADHPFLKLQAKVLARFTFEEFSGMVWDEDNRRLVKYQHANLLMRSMGSEYDVMGEKPKKVSFDVDRLLDVPQCRLAKGMMFRPDTEDPYVLDETVDPPAWRINKFNPADVPEAIKGDIGPALWAIDNICCDTMEAVPRLLTIAAYHAQNPTLIPKYGLLFVGDKGASKSNLAKLIGLALSKRFHDSRVKLSGEFNGDWRGFACKEWPEFDPDASDEDLKALITSRTYQVKEKYGLQYDESNHTLNIFTTNTMQAHIQEGDRRMLICGSARAKDKIKGLEFEAWVNGMGPNYFRHFLMNYDSSNYHSLDVWTELRDEVIDASKSYKGSVKDIILSELNEVEGLEIIFNAHLTLMLEEHRVNTISFNKENGMYFVKPGVDQIKIKGSVMKMRCFKNHEKWRKCTDTDKYREQYVLGEKLIADRMKSSKY